MAVYAAHAEKIGTVQQVDLTNGWFQTEKGVLFARDRWIPFYCAKYQKRRACFEHR
jgi:hypothetical protein